MRRFWLALGALGAANLFLALGLAFWLPSPAAADPVPPAPRSMHPYFTISPDAARFENRVRAIIRREFQQGALPGELTPVGVRPPGERAGMGMMGGREEGRDRPPRPRREQQTTAILTPFGLYSSGVTGVALAMLSLATLLALGAATLYLAPERLRVLRENLGTSLRHRLRLGAIGLLGYLVGLLLILILAVLVVGLPVALGLVVLLAAASLAGWVAVSLVMGSWLRERLALGVASPLSDLALGTLLLFPLSLVPLLGWALVLLVSSVGFGAILLTKFGNQHGWSLDPLE
ncbi:MAG: hypothetical protein HYY02_08220 [Chloroflexi bacterium]|nr:hypothetical protein [Chloroflexota bacterium]